MLNRETLEKQFVDLKPNDRKTACCIEVSRICFFFLSSVHVQISCQVITKEGLSRLDNQLDLLH